MSNVFTSNDLKQWKNLGIIKQVTNNDKVISAFNSGASVYCGFDPTGPSLHVGHLVQLVMLKRLNEYNLNPIALLGGGTAEIGDPSGKSKERVLLSEKTINLNLSKIKIQLKKILPAIIIKNNATWLSKLSIIKYLRNFGKHFPVNQMVEKEVVKNRLNVGISYTEFSYMLLQSIDFYELYINQNCKMQFGGSDQWGNITAGTTLLSKLLDDSSACGFTLPLLVKEDGKKFGKTAANTSIWLDEKMTTPYELYQFFWNQDDNLVKNLLIQLTTMSYEVIENIMKRHLKNRKLRFAQESLADWVVTFVHGKSALKASKLIKNILFKKDLLNLKDDDIELVSKYIMHFKVPKNTSLIDFMVWNNIISSKSEGYRLIKQGGISLNNKQVIENKSISCDDFKSGYAILKKGKRNFYILTTFK